MHISFALICAKYVLVCPKSVLVYPKPVLVCPKPTMVCLWFLIDIEKKNACWSIDSHKQYYGTIECGCEYKKSYYVVKTIPAWGQPSRFGANHSNLGLSDAVWGKTIFHGNSSGYDKKLSMNDLEKK